MYRTIWSYYFITGLLSLTAGVPVMDTWAASLLPQDGGATCRLAEAAVHFTRADLSLCLASWVNEARAAAGSGFGILAEAHPGMPMADWMRAADVVLIACGLLAALLAGIWLWANAMTRLASLSLTGTYTLVRAVGLALERRGYSAS